MRGWTVAAQMLEAVQRFCNARGDLSGPGKSLLRRPIGGIGVDHPEERRDAGVEELYLRRAQQREEPVGFLGGGGVLDLEGGCACSRTAARLWMWLGGVIGC